ncbi:hypothetical protein MA16_Dca010392 [Dendrobium catenatum]|uniref:DUF4371 domain-containing protein n=1 Tax=Dendrobium catenatum TaxID=906689 RepID=A0A2I0X882_9ASPA|nr:hypothetical protein MA16_Dca010392 [Dendrobium catenatum]
MNNICDSYFTTLVDESCDVSTKEQFVVAVRFVEKLSQVIERFICISHGYDEASNMQ